MKKQFDRFTLTDLVAQGAGGSLYLGEENLPGGVLRPVMVKVLPGFSRADPNAEARFVEEVRVLAGLAAQPHVVVFYGVGITEGTPWIAIEQITMSVEAMLGKNPVDPAVVAKLIEHVALGMASLHELQPMRLHNRLQPGNILVCGGGRHFKITEFGLAAPVNVEPMLSSDSVRYAAPELISAESGKPGPSTDLYALGHIAYELALGSKLHREQFPAVADGAPDLKGVNPARWQAWHHSMPTMVLPTHEVVRGFPPRLGEIIAKLMSKPIPARYGSAMDVVNDLDGVSVAAGETAVATTPAGLSAGFAATRAAAPQRTAASPAPVNSPPVVAPTPLRSAVAMPAASAAGQRYFVRLRDQMSGPYDLSVLQRMARQGQISRLHQVSIDQKTWKSAGSVEGLF